MNTQIRRTIPRFYYLMTPAFILLDYLLGVNIRAAALDAFPLYKNVYYGFCILCGIVVFVLPQASAIVALVESVIIIFITMLSVLQPLLENLEQAAELTGDWKAAEAFHFEGTMNLLMAATITVIAFRTSLADLAKRSDVTNSDMM